MGAPQTVQLKDKTKNQINVLHPYRDQYGIWKFDDAEVELQAEPFVGDINRMIDMYANGKKQITVYISKDPMPQETLVLEKATAATYPDMDVTEADVLNEGWYKLKGTDIVGWLCPATLKYFEGYPDEIHVKFEI